jgi:lipopolysaccharide transport system ATP-binding protein
MSVAIRVENLGKRYRLGVINRKLFVAELQSRWARWRGREDPHAKIVEVRRGDRSKDQVENGHFWALRDIDFELRQGEVVGFIGPNGSGKSTLLKLLSKVTAPTAGRILVKGQIASLLEVGTGFHPDLTGRENVFLNGAILGMTRAEITRKFDEIVDFAELAQFIDTPVKRYSSGMYVRLAFAVAAHLQPEIMIVDEVLAVGDASFQRKCIGKMGEVARTEGRTVLFVSHNMSAIQRICERAFLLDAGRIVAQGEVDEVIEDYIALTSEVEKAAVDRQVADGEAGIVSWRLRQPERSDPYSLVSGSACTLIFRMQNRRPALQPHIGLAIYSEEGMLIWAGHSSDDPAHLQTLAVGDYDITFRLPALPLRGGNYQLVVSVNERSKHLDVWHAQPKLHIVSSHASTLHSKWHGVLEFEAPSEIAPAT